MSDYVTKTNVLSALGRFKENTDNLYETKADANDVKNALQATNKRVTNLEQKAGDELTITYPHVTYGMDEVPANVAEYAKVTKLRGVSRVENQLIDHTKFLASASVDTVTITSNGDGTLTVVISATTTIASIIGLTNNSIASYCKVPVGHVYLIADKNSSSMPSGVAYRNGYIGASIGLNTIRTQPSSSSGYILLELYVPSGISAQTFTIAPNITDLTQYFGADPSVDVSTLTVSDIQQRYSQLLELRAYNAGSIVDTTYSAVKSKGVNLWDEEAQVGNIDFDNAGNDITDSTRLRSGYIPCLPSTAYYCKCPITDVRFGFYDMDEHYLGSATKIENVGNTSFTTPSGAYFMRFRLASSYGVTYNHDIQICLNSYADKTTYHPYMTDTLTLPSPVTLRSAGSVADTLELNVEVDGVERRRQTRRVAQVDGGTLDWQAGSTDTPGKYRFTASLPIAISQNSTIAANILCTKYIALSPLQTYRCVTGVSNNANNSQIIVYDESYAEKSASEFKEYVTGLIFNYELADESVTLLDPIPDPFIQVEGGGTIRPTQSQTTKIDSSMTAEYLSLGA